MSMNGPLQIPSIPAIPTPPSAPKPNILQQLAEAVGQYPQMQQQAEAQRAQQSQVREKAFADQLAQIHELVSSRPELASDRQVMNTVANIYKLRGLPPPIVADPQSGQQKVDINALGVTTPGQQALQNPQFTEWFMKLPPANRKAISESSGLHFSDDVINAPQFNAPSAGEITSAVRAFSALPQEIASGATTIDGALATIKGLYPILKNSGVDPDAMLANLKPALTAKATAEIADKQAHGQLTMAQAQTAAGEINALIRKANSAADLEAVKVKLGEIDTKYRAQADAAKIQRDTADATRAYAEANRANSQAEKAHQEAQAILTGKSGKGTSHLTTVVNTLQRDYKTQQTAVEKIGHVIEFYKSQLLTTTTLSDDQKAAITKHINELQTQYDSAQKRADKSKSQYEALSHVAASNETPVPHDMKPGTVEYFQSLSPQDKQKYIANPKVPQDVRDYLAGIGM